MDFGELIKACKNNHRVAQKALYDQYRGQMFSICLRYCFDYQLACDALQEGFISVFENIHQIADAQKLTAWIKKIIIRSSLAQLRKNKSLHFTSLDDIDGWHEDEANVHNFEFNYNYEKLMTHLRSMPTGYQTIFSMYVLDDLDHKEIAALMDIDISTSRTQLFKARKYMQKLILNDKSLLNELKYRI